MATFTRNISVVGLNQTVSIEAPLEAGITKLKSAIDAFKKTPLLTISVLDSECGNDKIVVTGQHVIDKIKGFVKKLKRNPRTSA